MPSQKQLKWSQLKVGITVIVASVALGILLFLMSGTTGLFTSRITLQSYFDNAEGLRPGAPVRLNGVDIGNVATVHNVHEKDKRLTPVEVVMKISSKFQHDVRRDSISSLETAGVLGTVGAPGSPIWIPLVNIPGAAAAGKSLLASR